jgi:N-acetylmuramoyl-L-alanine amidase
MKRWLLLVCVFTPLVAFADWRSPPRGEGPDQIAVRRIGDTDYVAANDLARLLDATKFWQADVQRLELRTGPHLIALTLDSPFAVVDDTTAYLGAPVRSDAGEFQVPVSLVDHLPLPQGWPRLFNDPVRKRMLVLPLSGRVGTPRITQTDDGTRVVFLADHPDEAVVVARGRAAFRVRLGGLFTGSVPDSMPEGGLVHSLKAISAAGGSAFEFALDRAAGSFRLTSDEAHGQVVIEFTRNPGKGEPFAPEDPAGPRQVKVIVIDPGHGGADVGTRVQDVLEKDLTLALARVLAEQLEHRLGARVVFTRTDDTDPPQDLRAEAANRVHADLVLSLHFDGFSSARARGATAYCTPATFATIGESGDAEERQRRSGAIVLLPWRDVSVRHAVQGRALAEAVLSSMELAGQGPTRLRERMPTALLGVNAPGILLECATLTAPADRERVTQAEGLRQLAVAIADGVVAYQRHE